MSYKKIATLCFVCLINVFLPQRVFAEDRETLENLCIADVIKKKAREGKVVSSAGLINTCRFMADYIIENDSPPPFYLLPKYSSADVEDMREAFYGKW